MCSKCLISELFTGQGARKTYFSYPRIYFVIGWSHDHTRLFYCLVCMLRYIWTTIRWKLHLEKLNGSRLTGPKRLKMSKIETFRDIYRNVEIRAIRFSELRTVVIVVSFRFKLYVFKVSHFRVIHWPRGQKSLFFIPYNILRIRLVIWSYQIILTSGMYVEV